MLLSWIIPIAAWVAVAKMPDQYEASARVSVDTDSILRPLLRGLTVQTNVEQRLSLMTRTLLSRPNLEQIARMTDLDVRATTPEEMEILLNNLAKNIRINSARRANLYTISFQHEKPEVAKEVVSALLTVFVEKTLGDTRQDSNSAQKFLIRQIEEYEARLVEAENRIKEFKRKNMAMMSGAGQDYFELLQATRMQLEKAKLELEEATNRRDELKRQLVGEEPVFGFGNDSGGTRHRLDGRIEKLQERLDSLLLQFTDKHPDVIAIKDTLKNLEETREREMQANPVFVSQQENMQRNPVFQQTKIALGQAEASIASLRIRVKEYTQRVEELASKVDTIPEIEAQLKSLNRDYAMNKKSYDALLSRLESAKLSEKAEQTGDDVKFKVIDPPRAPLEPSGPDRFMLNTLGLLAGISAGVGLAFLLSQIRPAFYDRKMLQEYTGVPVFGVVSRLWTPELLRRKRLEFGAYIGVGIILMALYGGVLAFQDMNLGRLLGTVMGAA